jgi:hypothetical protein
MKPTRGGKRTGAGRKPRETPRKAVTICLEPEDAARFLAICQAQERSQSEQLTQWIRRAKIPRP